MRKEDWAEMNDPDYGHCETCSHYGGCNVCSECDSENGDELYEFDTENYDIDVRRIDIKYCNKDWDEK